MKKMTCRELGGPCDHELTGETAEELGGNGAKHVADMAATGDEGHQKILDGMNNMSEEDKAKWYAEFQPKFDAAPEA